MTSSSGIVLDLRNLADLYDDSRYHNPITNHNAIPVRGIHGRGMYFNGTNAYMDCGHDASLNTTNAITIETWMKRNIINVTQGVLSKRQTGKVPYLMEICHTNVVYWACYDGTWQRAIGSHILEANKWYHIIGTYNQNLATDNFKLYINGREDGTKTYTLGLPSNADELLWIGRYGTSYFNGTISLARIYNYALSADETKLHYRQQSPYFKEVAPTICL